INALYRFHSNQCVILIHNYPAAGALVVVVVGAVVVDPVTVVPPPGALVVREARTEGRHVRQQYSIFMAFEFAGFVQNWFLACHEAQFALASTQSARLFPPPRAVWNPSRVHRPHVTPQYFLTVSLELLVQYPFRCHAAQLGWSLPVHWAAAAAMRAASTTA
ncbi:hypothetical protein PMAYCL1PPCAC_16828, partial [Pristionchus mayeri]